VCDVPKSTPSAIGPSGMTQNHTFAATALRRP
jgi:hypothetical protein